MCCISGTLEIFVLDPDYFRNLAIASVTIALFAMLAHRVATKATTTRSAELARFAEQQGWSIDPFDFHPVRSVLARLPPFARGRGQNACRTMQGKLETSKFTCEVIAGDYRYREPWGIHGRRTKAQSFSYLAFRLPFGPVHDLTLRPETAWDKLVGAARSGDVRVASGEFNRRFHVTTSNLRYAYVLLHDRLMQFMLANDPPRIDVGDGYLSITTGLHSWSGEQFDYWLRYARAFFELWPPRLGQTHSP